MAPEMRRKLPYTLSVGCWSLGITLFQLFTGTIQSKIAPDQFQKGNDHDHGNELVSFVSFFEDYPKLPAEANALLELALVRDPKKRASASELVRHATFSHPAGTGRSAATTTP